MYDSTTDGRLQVTAALSLLEFSRLVKWDPGAARFAPVARETFESAWRKDVDSVFGRLICWIIFSAGAEFLAKGVCLINHVEIRRAHQVPVHPSADLENWVAQFRKNWRSAGTLPATDFGTLGQLYTNRPTSADPALKRLCDKVKAGHDQQELLLATYEFLARTIRNRDAHAYVPHVRDYYFSLVPELFARCFNLLVSWLPSGPRTLNEWRQEAEEYIAAL